MPSVSKSKVYFFFEKPVNLKGRRRLKKYIQNLFKEEKYQLKELRYIFCTDKQLLEINRKYLNHNFHTDVISFPFSTQSAQIEGEIYISIDRVKENAKHLKEPFSQELLRVIFHGALHLCGYSDKTKKEQKEMIKAENNHIIKYISGF